MYSQVRNVHGPITFHLLKKGEKKIYLFGDRHYKDPAKCPSSQNIVSLLNDIKERHNLFIEGSCRKVSDYELTNYICEILNNVKSSETRNIFYSDRRYTHNLYIMVLMQILSNLIDNNYLIFLLAFHRYKYENEHEEQTEEGKTNEDEAKALLTDFDEGVKMADLEKILYDELINKDNDGFWQLKNYGTKITEIFPKDEFDNIMNLAENIFNMIYEQNKNKGETLENFVNRLKQQWEVTNDLDTVNNNIEIPQQANILIFQNDEKKKELRTMNAKIAYTAGAYMDIYLLASFLLSNINNNVVYAGDHHIRVYVRVLTNLGFTKEFSYENNNQCTPLGDTKLPLFSFR